MQSDDIVPIEMRVCDCGAGRVDVQAYQPAVRAVGMETNTTIRDDPDRYVLAGGVTPFEFTRSECRDVIDARHGPVLLDGSLRWPPDTADEL